MAAFKKHIGFFSTVIVLVLLAIAGLVFIFLAAGKSSGAADKLKKAETNLKSALALAPAPTPANVEASEANITELEQVLSSQVESTQGKSASILKQRPPTTGTNMYYDLLAYKNELDKDAKVMQPYASEETGVSVPENFDWGFSRFLQAGAGSPPPESAIPALFRQKVILNYLLRKLLATGPQSIVSVQREPVTVERPKDDSKGGGKGNKEDAKGDEFWMGKESAAIPGIVSTTAFRITFTGYTQNLRAFLKEIANFELPLVVRSVEVKPAEPTKTAAAKAKPDDIFAIFGGSPQAAETTDVIEKNQEPVVKSNISEFTIVIEYIEVTIKS